MDKPQKTNFGPYQISSKRIIDIKIKVNPLNC